MRPRFTKLLPALLAVVALSAVVASAAQAATEGPFYKVAKARLTEGQTKEVTSNLSKSQITIEDGSITIICDSVKLATGAKLDGSTGANGGFAEGTFELSQCETRGALQGCVLEGGAIKTEPLKLELVFLSSERSGPLGVDLVPINTKKIFAPLHFKPGCESVFKNLTITGSIVAHLETSKSELIEVGKEPAEAKTLQVKLPFPEVHKVWLEKGGSLTAITAGLERNGSGEAMSAEGIMASLELAGGTEWGVYTK
jgi:hypothetical protein